MCAAVAIAMHINKDDPIDDDMQKVGWSMLFENNFVTRIALHLYACIQDDAIQIDDMLEDIRIPREGVLCLAVFHVHIGGNRFIHVSSYPDGWLLLRGKARDEAWNYR